MTYFSRRNKYLVEFSGHEEISPALRSRIRNVVAKYVDHNGPSYGVNRPWFVEPEDFHHVIRQEFPRNDPFTLLEKGVFHEVFSIVEIFLGMLGDLEYQAREDASREMKNAFYLSGSVYGISDEKIALRIDSDLATSIEETKEALKPFATWYKVFFEAIGDLVGRRAKAEDVVKNIFIATEGYLKEKTGKTRFSESVNHLHSKGVINREQRAILEKLYAYRSDAAVASHAGNSEAPNEKNALWYLETILPQIRHIHRATQAESE